jgi:hypothetical protein
LDPAKVKPITIHSDSLVELVNHRAATNMTAESLGLLLSGEPGTSAGGIHESTGVGVEYHPVPAAAAVCFGGRQGLPGSARHAGRRPNATAIFHAVNPEALPRALDHLNVVWKVVAGQCLFTGGAWQVPPAWSNP